MTAVLQSPSHLPSSPSSSFSCTPNDGAMQSRSLLSQDDPPATPAEARGAKDQVEGSSSSPAAADSAVRRKGRKAQRHTEEEEEEQEPGEEESSQLSLFALLLTIFRRSLLGCRTEREKDGHHQFRSSMEIGWPTQVRHVAHVTFDRFEGFLGLPDEFEPDVPRRAPSASTTVFGVSTESMQCSYDSRGNSVPTILLMMQKHLYSQGGLEVEGIFRITADNAQEELVRDQLNSGVVPDGIDVHCLAGLIKAWFRELPNGVLDSLTAEQVMECQSEDDYVQLVRFLPHAESALLDWAVNLMADVVQEEQHNKMNAHNVATVFAPNMTQMADPLTALMHAVQVMNLLKTLILKALRERKQGIPDGACAASQSEPSDENDKRTPSKVYTEAYKEKAAAELVQQEAAVAEEQPSDLLKEDTGSSDVLVSAPVAGAKDVLGQSSGSSTTDDHPAQPTPTNGNSDKSEEATEAVSPPDSSAVHPTPTDDTSAKGEATAEGVSVPNASASQASVRRKKVGQPSCNGNSKRTAPPALKKPSIRAAVLPAAASPVSEKSRGISTLGRMNSKVERVEAWR